MKFFEWLDSIQFLQMRTWDFSFRSLLREYGRDFIQKVMLRHPIQTARGILHYRRLQSGKISQEQPEFHLRQNRGKSVVGVGFCLKPLTPPCASGRGNHNCVYFEQNLFLTPNAIPLCCELCTIKEIGVLSLAAGHAFYIMTSARDILYDLLLPSLEKKHFSEGIFALCRYSFDPFQIALCIAGVQGKLFPYEKNDCQDYPTWLLADVGIKEKQTEIDPANQQAIQRLLIQNSAAPALLRGAQKRGNIFYPP